jgi:hypothetical protein
MKRKLSLAAALLAGTVLALFLAHARSPAYPQPPPALVTCDNWVTCPEHNVSSTWTRKTKELWNQQRMQYCTYGEYSHTVVENGQVKLHKFWNFCGCPEKP